MRYCQVCHRCFGDGAEYCLFDQTHTFLIEQLPVIIDGKYRLEQLIAHGGMGSVYRAVHQQLERPVAIKILRAEFLSDRIVAERFNREARAAAKLKHPNIVAIYDFGSMPNGGAYLVMELIDGRSLREELRSHSAGHGQMRPERAVVILSQVCAGIEAAHRHGIVHRDLKPDNVMIEATAEASERVLVLDFGIAKLKDRDQGMQGLTDENTVIGTPNYISPEQCTGQTVDARSDIYSLGVILYEMLTGRTPFASQNTSTILLRHLQELPAPPSRFRAGLSRELEQVVLRALAKNPSHRFSSAGQFAEHLYAAVRSSQLYIEDVHEEFEEQVETLARRPAISADEITGFQPNPVYFDMGEGRGDGIGAGMEPARDDELTGFRPRPVILNEFVSAEPEPEIRDEFTDRQPDPGFVVRLFDSPSQPNPPYQPYQPYQPYEVEDGAEGRSPTLLIERQPRTRFNVAVVMAVLVLLGFFGYLWMSEWQAKADESSLKSKEPGDSNDSLERGARMLHRAENSSGPQLTNTVPKEQTGEQDGMKRSESANSDAAKTLPASFVRNEGLKSEAKTDSTNTGANSAAEVAAKRDVRTVYDEWTKSAVRGDWVKHLDFYADSVDYFRDRKLTRAEIGSRKRNTFRALDSYSLTFSPSPQISMRQDGGAQEADISYDRSWRLKRNGKWIDGKAHGVITLRRESRGWRIVSEKQIRK